ncbi:flagellar biosynthetic protein FliO [Thalassotalea hakodatensis]|uniref:flagellar biosynthetic protein FliO n=1 Tax=Thalassotalea hakodatensis TaxID=3030492 RepID=UPI0025726FB2|nr:flagellar biosynthetic protein FliO [Thalassotalea hakodatensis]
MHKISRYYTLRCISSLLVLLFPVISLAQENNVEVGKHANVNMDAASMILALLLVLALIVVSAFVLKKFTMINKVSSGMKVIASLPLGSKEKLMVIQVGDEQLLLGVCHQQVTLIKTLETPLPENSPITGAINNPLAKFINQKINNNRE